MINRSGILDAQLTSHEHTMLKSSLPRQQGIRISLTKPFTTFFRVLGSRVGLKVSVGITSWSKSGRDCAHSKTFGISRSKPVTRQRRGVRQPPAAFLSRGERRPTLLIAPWVRWFFEAPPFLLHKRVEFQEEIRASSRPPSAVLLRRTGRLLRLLGSATSDGSCIKINL